VAQKIKEECFMELNPTKPLAMRMFADLVEILIPKMDCPCWLLQEINVGDLVNIVTEDISGDRRIASLLGKNADVVQGKITLQVFAGIKRRQ
jgi:hypothetical protein